MNQVSNQTPNCKINCANLLVENSPYRVGTSDGLYAGIPEAEVVEDAVIDESIGKWFFLSGSPNL